MNDSVSARTRPLLVAGAAAAVVAALGAFLTDLGPWYYALHEPPWKPPDWLFGPVWTLIFVLTALAAVSAWSRTRSSFARAAVLLSFAVNGVLNIGWSVLFFRLRRPDWAAVEVIFLFLSVLALIAVTGRHSRIGAWMLAPYALWVAYAGVLNWVVARDNGPFN